MQRERSILELFPENIDLNQGSGSSNATMDRSAAWNNLLSPVESRLSDYVFSSGQGNPNFVNPASHNGRNFGGWDPGESSSSANMQSQLNGPDPKIGQGWSPSVNTCVAADGRSLDWQFERPNVLHESSTNGYRGNYFHRPLSIHNSVSTHTSLNATVSGGYRSSSADSWQGRGSDISPNIYRTGRPDIDQFPTFGAASNDVGTSSGSSGYMVQHDDDSGSSSTWGLSCKRKALEGNPGQACSSGNWSMGPQDGTIGRQTVPACYNASSSSTASAPYANLHSANNLGQVNPRMVPGMREMAYEGFPPSRIAEVAESSQRNFSFGVNLGHPEPVPYELSAAGPDVRHSNAHSTNHQLRLMSTTESPELMRAPFSRPVNLNSTASRSNPMQVHGLSRSMLPFPSSESLNSRGGASSGPVPFSGERGAAVRDEATFRSFLSNNLEHSSFADAPESRHMVLEPTGWNFSAGRSGSSRDIPSSSQITSSSGPRPLPPVWMPHQNPTAHNQQRVSEFPPWTLFPSVEPDPGGQRGQFSFFPSASSSLEEAVISSGSSSEDHSRAYSRSLLMEAFNDDINSWRALAAGIGGRQRIVSEIRQVLNAMRRTENLRDEDYVMFDPFIDGAAELHDRHRDMRLDVDNMSYEELLALEERIGNVSTGLSEDAISHALRQRKHQFVTNESQKQEPCSICQEDYTVGDDVGTLDCRHEFHANCIKQWLTLKNLCPICKTTALET